MRADVGIRITHTRPGVVRWGPHRTQPGVACGFFVRRSNPCTFVRQSS
ncbi:hypothetical protein L810_5018 [Burkholderia sp. AU4i]|nr:hypothetical protein L810_5018 [Burkholderia sp. AU4i]